MLSPENMAQLPINHPDEFDKLSIPKKELLVNWINTNIIKGPTASMLNSSYKLKHLLEGETGMYLTNGEFKGGMLECGFRVKNKSTLNWCFYIDKTSPVLKMVQTAF